MLFVLKEKMVCRTHVDIELKSIYKVYFIIDLDRHHFEQYPVKPITADM